MQSLDLTLTTPAENLALDEALLLNAEAGSSSEMLRFWQSPTPCVVLGAGSRLAEVNQAQCLHDGVPILRRASGGGTVLLGPGCLLFTLVLRYDRAPELTQIGSSYCWILQRIVDGLTVADLQPAGISDLALGDRKVSGNAQQRKRDHLLHHGTLLYAFDADQVARYLHMPLRQPEYRRNRRHRDFLANLPLSRNEMVARLQRAFDADAEKVDWPRPLVQQLVSGKYGCAQWTRRR